DYAGLSSAALARHFRLISSEKLPVMPTISISDKQNDKGDNLVISVGKPIAYVVTASYVNSKRTALRVNYEIANNENYKIDKLLFTFLSADGEKIDVVTEHFVDKTVRLKLPGKYAGLKDLKIKIALETTGSRAFEADYTEQHVVYDDDNKLFKGEEVLYRGEPISKQYMDILVKNSFAPDYFPGNKTNGTTRSYDHGIPYESMVYQQIVGVDKASKRIMFDPVVNIAVDHETGNILSIPLFKSKFETGLQDKEKEIAQLKTALAAFPAGAAPDSLTSPLQQLESEYKYITTHPAYLKAKQSKSPAGWLRAMLNTRKDYQRAYAYKLLKSDGRGAFVITEAYKDTAGNMWFSPKSEWFNTTMIYTLIATLLLVIFLIYAIYQSHHKEAYIRPIAGLHEIDNALGRATEMGKPVMFVPGWGGLGDVCTIASLMILSQVAKKAAEFDIRLISPHCDYMVLPLAQEIVQSSFSEAGRPDAYNQNDIFFISDNQFPFCAGVNGITVRERVATIFYMGFFNAEALLLTETGNQAGAIQIAGTDSTTQVPFFITTCDYTLIGEEFYAASAYLSRAPQLVSMLKAQDYFKLVLVFVVIIGTVLSTFNLTGFINSFPVE
ncbi:MAG: hypothetical protein PHO32_10410, partial [Candidatus Cloacimonetes bacterium]|nr:hypothetical protein [Candidatus Cloacimonadota bacterium]